MNIREIVHQIDQENLRKSGTTRFSSAALGAVQEATEHAVLELMQMSNLAAIHARRVTLMVRDMRFVRQVFGVHDPSVWFATDGHSNHSEK